MSKLLNYNESTGVIVGAYADDIEYPGGIPSPNVKVSDSDWAKWRDDQQNYIIVNGVLTYSPKTYTDAEKLEQALAEIRAKRDDLLNDVIWEVDRHKQQLELVSAGKLTSTTLTSEQYLNLLVYIQELRELPNEVTDPGSVTYPAKPEGI
jgi:hypothetical protein